MEYREYKIQQEVFPYKFSLQVSLPSSTNIINKPTFNVFYYDR